MTRQDVINLIIKMHKLNQTEQARTTFARAHKTWPEWDLKNAPELLALKGEK